MEIIPRNHTRKIAQIREAVRYCEQYDRSTSGMIPADIDDAFNKLFTVNGARLSVETPGKAWHIRYGQSSYLLTIEEPEDYHARKREQAKERAAERDRAEAERRRLREEAATALREAAQQEHGPGVVFPEGFDSQTQAAAHAIGERQGRHPDRAAGDAAEIALKVKELLARGWSHKDIRAFFTQHAEHAERIGDPRAVDRAQMALAVHAGMLADMAALAGVKPPAAGPGPLKAADRTALEAPKESAEPPAPVLPAYEADYTPVRGAKPYQVRKALEALEAGGVPVRGENVEFWLTLTPTGDSTVNVSVLSVGKDPGRTTGRKEDRRELRRAQVVVALLEGGMTDAVMLRGGVRVRVPRPGPRAATLVEIGKADYSHARFIDRPVSLPQYPAITGWVRRCRWGNDYIGPMDPWMEHTDGTQAGMGSRDDAGAARALCLLYGLLEPVRVVSSD